MAKFINFNIVGGTKLAGAGPDPSLDGDNLVLVDSILNVKAEAAAPGPGGGGGEYQVSLALSGGGVIKVTCSTDAEATDPVLHIPTATNYLAQMKKAVNRAITANPGGVKASVILPQDSDDPNAKYDPALRVYWKNISF